MKWLNDIKVGSKPIVSKPDFDVTVNQLKAAKCDVPSIDSVFENLPFTKVNDEIHINDARFRDLEVKFRKGEIKSALDDANISNTIPVADEAALRKTIKAEAPDIDVQELNKKIDTAKKYHEDLNVTAKDGAELESKLSAPSKEKAKSMYSKIVAGIAIGGTATGLFTALIVTGEVFEDIANANNSRNGCFLVYKNTETVACKLPSRSCGYGSNGAVPCSSENVEKTKYNIYLMVHNIFQQNDEASIAEMKDAGIILGTDNEDPSTYSPDVTLETQDNVGKLIEYYNEKYPSITDVLFDPCAVSGITEGCVSCNTTASTNSVEYATTELLDGNLTYMCIEDSTVIDTLTDIATTLGVDLFTASGDSLSGSFQGNFFLSVIIVLVLVFAIALAIKFIPKKKGVEISDNTPGTTTPAVPVAAPVAPYPTVTASPVPPYRPPMENPNSRSVII